MPFVAFSRFLSRLAERETRFVTLPREERRNCPPTPTRWWRCIATSRAAIAGGSFHGSPAASRTAGLVAYGWESRELCPLDAFGRPGRS